MVILGHGIDIIELQRVQRHLSCPENDWLESVFTLGEQAAADPPPNNVAYYAGRYAAKEAVVKALGTGFSDDVTWLDVEIVRLPSGAPAVQLTAGAASAADELGVIGWLVSISHSEKSAVASALALGS